MEERSSTTLSVIIPTYQREQVLIETIRHLLEVKPPPGEILIIDQTDKHTPETLQQLTAFENMGKIRWLRLPYPLIPHAMNVGLKAARHDIVLFLDDDIIPHKDLIAAHSSAHGEGLHIVAGQVLQPGEKPLPPVSKTEKFLFRSSQRQTITDLMAGNFSIKRHLAIALGGFDENFVQVAYRFETEFAERVISSGERIFFEPSASIRHLKVKSGGTRSYGEHLKTIKPSHSVGEYYYLMRSRRAQGRFRKILSRPFRAIWTKHHLYNPWWIPATLISELLGLAWAGLLFLRGPRHISQTEAIPAND